MPIHVHLFRRTILSRKVGQTDLVFGRGSLVGLCVQDYKSLCAAVTIYATLVNIQMQTDTQTAFLPAHMNSWNQQSYLLAAAPHIDV